MRSDGRKLVGAAILVAAAILLPSALPGGVRAADNVKAPAREGVLRTERSRRRLHCYPVEASPG